MSLVVDFCNHKAAKYAVEHWHYSRSMPSGKCVKVGVWENDVFIGVVIFSRGANNNIGKPFNLHQGQICELTRVALDNHINPVSKIVSLAIKKLKQTSELELIVSYADPKEGHVGIIYQAMNWFYIGKSVASFEVLLNNRWVHAKTANSKVGTIKGLSQRNLPLKHKYIYPLNRKARKKYKHLCKPYPKE